ncbi:hypothetical protein QEN19_000131 [Hanseniaspora menglaensis]
MTETIDGNQSTHYEEVIDSSQEVQKHLKIEHLQPESNKKVKRVYFTNVPYDLSEDEFAEFLEKYEPVSVLIPYQYVVRFGNKKTVQPLGVAYADFSSPEKANIAVLELAGTQIPGKKQTLRAKLFEAYDPKRSGLGHSRESKFLTKLKNHYFKTEAQPAEEHSELAETDIEGHEKTNQNDPSSRSSLAAAVGTGESNSNSVSSRSTPKLSTNWVYVTKMASGTLDVDLAKHFAEFFPSDIYVFKFRPQRQRNKIFHKIQLAAIIKFPDVDGIENIAVQISEKMNGSVLNNTSIVVKPSFEKKVHEVVDAAESKEGNVDLAKSHVLTEEQNAFIQPEADVNVSEAM